MEIIKWPIEPELKKKIDEHYRTEFAMSLVDKEPLEIIREITFDGVAPEITIKDIEIMLDHVNREFLQGKLGGDGVEVGAGCGVFSAVLARRPEIKKMYALEVVENIVEKLMPKVVESILSDQKKIVGCVGDFNRVGLPDGSADFVFDFYSLHHSNDLRITLAEAYRILKPGGFVFCFDKARPDHYTDQQLVEMVDQEYNERFKESFGIPADKKLTRRMNGEHEFRLKDWEKTFIEVGFKKVDYYFIRKTTSGRKAVFVLKKFLAILPIRIQKVINPFVFRAKDRGLFGLEKKNTVFSELTNKWPKEISLIIAWK